MSPPLATQRSLVDYLWHWEQSSPDRLFVEDDTETALTYRDAAQAIRATVAELHRRAVRPGDRVAVLAENSAWWIIAFLATLAARAIAVPMATRLTSAELEAMLTDAQPAVVATDASLLGLLGEAWLDRVLMPCPEGEASAADRASTVDSDCPACLTYTSGTTSRPKGVLLSSGSLTASSETYAALFHSTPAMHTIVAVPLCHNTGFIDQLGHVLVAGGSIAAHRRFRAERVAASLLNGDCTFFIGVPTMYQRIVDHLVDAPTTDIAPWLAFGGAPMPGHLIERLHHVFPRARLANCYGLSEATSITHINFVDADSSTTAVGVAVAGTLDRISPLGELLVCSPTTMLGYFNDPATTAAKFDDGWLLTGDLAERGDDGVVHVYGRVDDVINRGGEKILPIEIEEALCAHPAIVDAAVVGVPDAEYGSVVAAAVVSASALTAAEIAEFLESRLADHKLPARLITVAELPRNANGKILPAAVRELFR